MAERLADPAAARARDRLTTGAAPFYRCADGQFVAVGAVEDGFFRALWDGLGLPPPCPADRFDPAAWPGLAQVIGDRFATAGRDEWAARFAGVDACVTPVLAPDEVLAAAGRPGRGPDRRAGRDSGDRTPRPRCWPRRA